MEHGDVLISTTSSQKESNNSNDGLIVASKKTFAAITNRHSSAAKDTNVDPLQSYDPWEKYVPSNAVSQSQIAQIESNVQKKVVAVLQTKSGEDVSMESVVDGRVTHN